MKWIKYIFNITLIYICLGANYGWCIKFKEKNILTVCAYNQFRPISYGKGEGYEADLLKAIAALWQIKIQFFPESVYEGLWRLPSQQYSKCDIAMGGFLPLKDRVGNGALFSIKTLTAFNPALFSKNRITNGGSYLVSIPILNKGGFAFAVDKNNPDLQQALNKAIQKITNNGKLSYPQWVQNHKIFNQFLFGVDGMQYAARKFRLFE